MTNLLRLKKLCLKNFTETSHQSHTDFNPLFYLYPIKKEYPRDSRNLTVRKKEVTLMFLGLEWYWWLVILAVLAISVPFKVKFLKWWGRRAQEKKEAHGKWGDEE